MNRKFVILSAVILWLCFIAMTCFCYSTDGIIPGFSTQKDLSEKIGHENILYYCDVFIYENFAGNYVVGHLDTSGTWKVTDVQVVGASGIAATPLHFAILRQGMTPAQVTALVGKPTRLLPTGLTYLGYTAVNGNEYVLCWKSAPSTVTSSSATISEFNEGSFNFNIKAFVFNHVSAALGLSAIAATIAAFPKQERKRKALPQTD